MSAWLKCYRAQESWTRHRLARRRGVVASQGCVGMVRRSRKPLYVPSIDYLRIVQRGDHFLQADFSVLISLWLGQITSGWPTNCPNVGFDFNSEIRSIADSTPCKARQGIYSKRPEGGTGDKVPAVWASLNSTRPRIVLPRQLFLTTSSSKCADCQGQ